MSDDPGDPPPIPEISPDDGDVGWGDLPVEDDDDRLRRDVPPHHGT